MTTAARAAEALMTTAARATEARMTTTARAGEDRVDKQGGLAVLGPLRAEGCPRG